MKEVKVVLISESVMVDFVVPVLANNPLAYSPARLVIFSTTEDLRGNTAGLVELRVRLNVSANSFQHTAVRGRDSGALEAVT